MLLEYGTVNFTGYALTLEDLCGKISTKQGFMINFLPKRKWYMKYTLNCDIMDGLVFIDESYLIELNNDDLLYAMDILLDLSGTSELIFDFPDEDWDTVRQRETEQIREFCGQGKMVVWLLENAVKECELTKSAELTDPCKWLHLPTGKLLAVTASELIQCLAYPELEMEKVFELLLEPGWYAIQNEGVDKIMYCKKQPPNSIFSNIQEIC